MNFHLEIFDILYILTSHRCQPFKVYLLLLFAILLIPLWLLFVVLETISFCTGVEAVKGIYLFISLILISIFPYLMLNLSLSSNIFRNSLSGSLR